MITWLDSLRSDPRRIPMLLRLDAIATASIALPMILWPTLLLRWLDLGSIAPWLVQVTGVIWLAFALWLAWVHVRPLGKGAAAFGIFMMVSNALELLLGPLLFDTGTGPLGWAAILGAVLFMDFMTLVWIAVWRGQDEQERVLAPAQARS
jgi:hypothetical protein